MSSVPLGRAASRFRSALCDASRLKNGWYKAARKKRAFRYATLNPCRVPTARYPLTSSLPAIEMAGRSTLVASYLKNHCQMPTAKANGWRTRPFVQMNDAIWAQYDDDNLRNNSSYPSGHSALGWYTALSFAEMWPELQDTILIVGYHWASDIEATRLLSTGLFARLNADPAFQVLVTNARAEYLKITGQDTSVGAPAAIAPSAPRAYRLDGTPATSRTHGIVIQNGQKIIRRE